MRNRTKLSVLLILAAACLLEACGNSMLRKPDTIEQAVAGVQMQCTAARRSALALAQLGQISVERAQSAQTIADQCRTVISLARVDLSNLTCSADPAAPPDPGADKRVPGTVYACRPEQLDPIYRWLAAGSKLLVDLTVLLTPTPAE